MQTRAIQITPRLSIPESELAFTASRSSGPGGQHVNKVNTRVTLWFDALNSPSLTEEERALVLTRLHGRVNKEGMLWVISQESRSQAANREAAIERFATLLREALIPAPHRKETRISRAQKLRRLANKRKRGFLKRDRTRPISSDD